MNKYFNFRIHFCYHTELHFYSPNGSLISLTSKELWGHLEGRGTPFDETCGLLEPKQMFASSLSHVSPANSWEVFRVAKYNRKNLSVEQLETISMEKVEKQEKS